MSEKSRKTVVRVVCLVLAALMIGGCASALVYIL